MYGAVAFDPVKVMLGDGLFLHTVVVPEIEAVGRGFTVTVALPVWVWLQAVEELSETLIKLYTNVPAVPVGAATITLLPLVVVTVCGAPSLIL